MSLHPHENVKITEEYLSIKDVREGGYSSKRQANEQILHPTHGNKRRKPRGKALEITTRSNCNKVVYPRVSCLPGRRHLNSARNQFVNEV